MTLLIVAKWTNSSQYYTYAEAEALQSQPLSYYTPPDGTGWGSQEIYLKRYDHGFGSKPGYTSLITETLDSVTIQEFVPANGPVIQFPDGDKAAAYDYVGRAYYGMLSVGSIVYSAPSANPPIVDDVVLTASGSGLTALYEGGPAQSIHVSLSHAVTYDITVHASLSRSPQSDLSFSLDSLIKAGSVSIEIPFYPAKDNILEPIESGIVSLTATGPSNIIVVQNNAIPLQITDEVAGPMGVGAIQPGLDWSKSFLDFWSTHTKIPYSFAMPTAQATKYVTGLEATASFAGVAIDGTTTILSLQDRLVKAEELSKVNPSAAAHYAYSAYEVANVSFTSSVIGSTLSGSSALFIGGVVAGVAGVGVTAALPILVTVGAGFALKVAYDRYIDPVIKTQLQHDFELQNPIDQFLNGYVASHPTIPKQAGMTLSTPFSGSLVGSGGDDILTGGSQHVAFDGLAGNDTLNGNSSLDTAIIHANIADSFITSIAPTNVTVASVNGFDTLNSVARVQFNDGVVAFDTLGNAGDAYRLYQAAFNRTPDKGGLSFWTHGLDMGIDIQSISQGFVNSAEFKQVYGSNPTNAHIVDLLYQNVLGRAGEPAGIGYWQGVLDRGVPIAAVLQGFAVSAENHAIVDPKLVQGIVLDQSAFLV